MLLMFMKALDIFIYTPFLCFFFIKHTNAIYSNSGNDDETALAGTLANCINFPLSNSFEKGNNVALGESKKCMRLAGYGIKGMWPIFKTRNVNLSFKG